MARTRIFNVRNPSLSCPRNVALKKETGTEPTLVRPPTGALNKAVEATYARVGLTNLLWDVDVDQGRNLSLADLRARVEAGVGVVHGRGWKTTTPSPTIVVLLHDIQRGTSHNLGAIIDHIKATVTKLSGGKDTADFSAPWRRRRSTPEGTTP